MLQKLEPLNFIPVLIEVGVENVGLIGSCFADVLLNVGQDQVKALLEVVIDSLESLFAVDSLPFYDGLHLYLYLDGIGDWIFCEFLQSLKYLLSIDEEAVGLDKGKSTICSESPSRLIYSMLIWLTLANFSFSVCRSIILFYKVSI